MNSKKRLRLILLADAAVLMIAGYLVYSAVAGRAQGASATVLFQATGIRKIRSSYAGEEQVFTKEQGVWTYAADAAFPLNPAYVEDMEEALLTLTASGEIKNGDPAEYGLAVPAFELSAIAEDGSEFACAVGNENDTADIVYIRTGGSIYTVDIGFSSRFSHTLLEMVQKQPLPDLQPSDVTAISVENGSGAWKLLRDGNGIPAGFSELTWVMDSGVPADAETIKSLLLAVAGMRAESCVAYKPDVETLAEYGLDSPSATIGISYGGADWTAQIGNRTEDGFYCVWLPDNGVICTFEAAVPERILTVTTQDCVNRVVFPVAFENLTVVEVTFGGETKRLDFREYGKAWDFYYALSSMRAEQIADADSAGDADVTVTVYTTDPNVTYVLAFRKYNEDFYSTGLFGYVQLVNKRDVEELLNIPDA